MDTSYFKYVISFVILLFTAIHAQADTYRLNASYYVRSSPKFGDQDNKIGTLTKGSTFKVIERRKLSNGAEALQISVKNLSPTSNLYPADEYWIYKPNDTDFLKMTIASETQASDPAAPCTDCGSSAQPVGEVAGQNAADIAAVSRTIGGQQNKPAEPAPLPQARPADAPRTPGSLDEKIKKYSESAEVQGAINHAMRNKYATSQGTCYRSVKRALATKTKGSSLIPHHYSDLAALNAKESLKQFGFINLLEQEPYKTNIGNSPSKAPKGAVLVYSSGIPCGSGKSQVRDCGHVEIKTDHEGKPGYVSDYYSRDAINETPGARRYGTRYRLVGVMIKP